MRERARDKGRINDNIEYSKDVEKLIANVAFDDFTSDIRTFYAVMKNIEIVGEAAYMLTNDFKSTHPGTPWSTIQGMRHVLVHGYASVNSTTLYETALYGIPELHQQAEQYMRETDWDAWASPLANETI